MHLRTPTPPLRHPLGRRTFLKAGVVAAGTGIVAAGGNAVASDDPLLGRALLPELEPGVVGRWWNAIGTSPSVAEVTAKAPRLDVIVLNAWDQDLLRAVKRVSPTTIVLVYKDLSSTRDYAGAVSRGQDAKHLPTGVGYVEAEDDWFARDREGERIEWAPYPRHFQMATWRADYRARWVANVTREVEHCGWDGVLADNDFNTLRFYSDAIVAGTSSRRESDALLRRGQADLVREAGAALRRTDRFMVTNVSEGRLDLDRWRRRAEDGGGAMEENFTSFLGGTNRTYLSSTGPDSWENQTEQLAVGLSLLVTNVSDGNMSAARFGFTSALVRARGRVAWSLIRDGLYRRIDTLDLQELALGSPVEQGEPLAEGTWARRFERGVAVVNPTSREASVRLPGQAGRRTVGAHDGLVHLGVV